MFSSVMLCYVKAVGEVNVKLGNVTLCFVKSRRVKAVEVVYV